MRIQASLERLAEEISQLCALNSTSLLLQIVQLLPSPSPLQALFRAIDLLTWNPYILTSDITDPLMFIPILLLW